MNSVIANLIGPRKGKNANNLAANYGEMLPKMIGDAVRARREQLGFSQEKLADLCGTTRGSIQHLEYGTVKQPRYFDRLLVVLQLTYDELYTAAQNPQQNVTFIPHEPPKVSIIPTQDAKQWLDPVTQEDVAIRGETHYISGSYSTFAVEVEGESMQGGPQPISPGEVIYCDPEATPAPGDIVLAEIQSTGAIVLRKLVRAEGGDYLSALNPNFAPILNDFTILAKAFAKYAPL